MTSSSAVKVVLLDIGKNGSKPFPFLPCAALPYANVVVVVGWLS